MPTDLLDKGGAAPAERRSAANTAAPGAGMDELLKKPARPAWRRLLRLLFIALLVVLAGAGGLWAVRHWPAKPAQYVTTPVRQGDLSVTVTVTGNLAPVNQVDVGSELSGTVEQILVDENDPVRRGQVLASLDTSRLRDQVALGQAQLATARANLAQASATLNETRLKAERVHRLYQTSNGGWPAKADVDAAEAAEARAVAAELAAHAEIRQAEAGLNTNRTNLTKAVIRSPVDGVVLSRKVEVGQTVAATLQAPVLFTIAQDMRRMELDADIDEADVGQVQEGQDALFTVDAYPAREFAARVTRVGFGSQTKEGVVTYKGVLSVDNADLSLRPGMTASADIRTRARHGVLIVPDAALRFTPPAAEQTSANPLMPRMPRIGAGPVRRSSDPNSQQIWILRNGKPVPLTVRVGASDGRDTEVSGPGLRPGLPVIAEAAGAGK